MSSARGNKSVLNSLASYLGVFGSGEIEGMFSPDAAVLFMTYNMANAKQCRPGHTLEIGVHHGLSAIAVAALRGPNCRFVAIDLFDDLQDQNVSRSGLGSRAHFERSMQRFYDDTSFVQTIAAPSANMSPSDLGGGFTFCHIDGGHSPEETCHDLELCSAILEPGGLLALDDYFNPWFPGVCEGAIRFNTAHPGVLRPLTIGFNKVLFQKHGGSLDANAACEALFPHLPHALCDMWDQRVFLLSSSLRPLLDLEQSTPQQLVLVTDVAIRARVVPEAQRLQVQPGEQIVCPVRVFNESPISFTGGLLPFGVSYHLLSEQGALLQFDHRRTHFREDLHSGQQQRVDMVLEAPERAGHYQVEIDVVWEGVAWLKDRGGQTGIVQLHVQPPESVPHAAVIARP